MDTSVVPRDRSTIPGYEQDVEQCGEFAYRYFRSQGKGYPTLGQPYNFLLSGKDHLGAPHPEFERYFNGKAEPPRAGDILVAKGPRPGQFHTAVVTKVEGDRVEVLQANVPYNWRDPETDSPRRDLRASFPLVFQDGEFTLPPLPTSKLGYDDDYPVIGWIRPTGEDALPQIGTRLATQTR